MTAILETPPAIEPISLQDAKLYLKVDNNADDELITRLISTARQHIEKLTQLTLITQTWKVYFDAWPKVNQLTLPLKPVVSITSLKTYSDQDIATTIDLSHYYADVIAARPKLVLRQSRSWLNPGRLANGIEIELVAGFGEQSSDVPEAIKQAILLLMSHWYENRQIDCAGLPAKDLGAALQSLLKPFKVARL